MTFQCMKKRPDENYREYVVRWKNVASTVRPSLTSREKNFMFVDTLPSPYYDMLIVNTFVEFGDLMYSVGRIENEIKRGRIVDIGASMREKKRIVPDEHDQTMSREKGGRKRRSHTTREEPVKNHPRSPGYAQAPLSISNRLKGSHKNTIKRMTQAITRARKGKGPKCIIHFQCLIQSCSPY